MWQRTSAPWFITYWPGGSFSGPCLDWWDVYTAPPSLSIWRTPPSRGEIYIKVTDGGGFTNEVHTYISQVFFRPSSYFIWSMSSCADWSAIPEKNITCSSLTVHYYRCKISFLHPNQFFSWNQIKLLLTDETVWTICDSTAWRLLHLGAVVVVAPPAGRKW